MYVVIKAAYQERNQSQGSRQVDLGTLLPAGSSFPPGVMVGLIVCSYTTFFSYYDPVLVIPPWPYSPIALYNNNNHIPPSPLPPTQSIYCYPCHVKEYHSHSQPTTFSDTALIEMKLKVV